MSKHHHERPVHDEPEREEPMARDEEIVEIEEEVAERATVPADRPRLGSAWEALKGTYALWKAHWKLFTGIQVIWGAVMIGLIILAAVLVGVGFGFLVGEPGNLDEASFGPTLLAAAAAHPAFVVALVVAVLVLAAGMALVSAWSSVATLQSWIWVRHEEHDRMSVRNAYAAGWPILPKYLWAVVLATLLVFLGLLGFVIPGLLLAVSFALLGSVAVSERLGGMKAISRTTTLARPHLMRIFWRALVTAVVLYLPARIVAGIINQMSDGLGDALDQIYGVVVAPIFTGVLYVTYLEAKRLQPRLVVKEWFSLEKLAASTGAVAALLILVAAIAGRF